MDRRFLTVLAVSLVFALVISSIFYQMARTGRSRGASKGDEKEIVVAVRPLSVGMTVKASDIKVAKIPVSAFPKGAFSHLEDVAGRPVISNILADEPVLEGRLAARGSGAGLAPVIPVGMRAVTVRVNDVVGVAGFVFPGMRVDVLVTGRPPQADGMVTSTCLQDILVLSAGTTMQTDGRGQAMPAPTVTLLVTPEQAETLTLASSDGRIQLVLRNSSDREIEKTPGREIAELYGMRAARPKQEPLTGRPVVRVRPVARVAPRPVAPPPPAPDEIVVIRGTKRSIEVLSRPSASEDR